MITRPDEWKERLRRIESRKLPAFFKFAKDKKPEQVTRRGRGVIDRIYDHIRICRFSWSNKSIPPFDYKLLMFNPNRPYGEHEEEVVQAFREAASSLQFARGVGFTDEENHNFYEIKKLQKHMEQYGRRQDVCDILVRGLFHEHKTPHKAAFWLCFNDVVYDNLVANLKEQKAQADTSTDDLIWKECEECGNEFKAKAFDIETICPACRAFGVGKSARRCVDCGAPLPPTGKLGGRPATRCAECQLLQRRRNVLKAVNKFNAKKN